MTAGYSSTPLAKKLGIKARFKVYLLQAPSYYNQLFSDWPEEVETIQHPKEGTVDFIHVFCRTDTDLELTAKQIPYLKKSGMLWVSWPKGTSKMETTLNRDLIRNYVLNAGLVDVKVAAIDADWSGLKFMYRLKDR